MVKLSTSLVLNCCGWNLDVEWEVKSSRSLISGGMPQSAKLECGWLELDWAEERGRGNKFKRDVLAVFV